MEVINFIANLQNYLSIVTSEKFNLFEHVEKDDKKLIPIQFLLKYKDTFKEHIAVQYVFDRMLIGLHLLDFLEKEKLKNGILYSIAKERKNIRNIQTSILATKNIFEKIEDKETDRKLEIIGKVFELFEEDDESTIELLSTTNHLSSIIDSGDADFDFANLMLPKLSLIVNNQCELHFLASLIKYFEGYRLTPEMFLHSLAIKLFNYPLYLFGGDKFKYSQIAKSVEILLSPFGKTEKFRVLPNRGKKFYIKSIYKGHYILAYSAKKNKERFSYIFNPEAFYLSSKNNWTKINPEESKIGDILFETADDYHHFMAYSFYSTIILSR